MQTTDPYKKNHEIVSAYFNMLADNMNHGLILLSKGGLGKTTLVLEALEKRNFKRNRNFLYANSFSTPLAFYNLLAQVTKLKAPRFLILDDMELILSNKHILGMLRSALWEAGGKRIVNYHSTSEKVEKTEGEFTGKIIMLLNDLPSENKILNALCDRVFFHEIKLTNIEIIQIIKDRIATKPYKDLSLKQRIKIAEAIEERTTKETKLSFRTLIKAYQFYIYSPNHWTQMLDSAMGIKEDAPQKPVDKKEQKVVSNNKLI